MEHYNLGSKVDEVNAQGCGESFIKFDQKYIKPVFVHEYSVQKQQDVDKLDEEFVRAKIRRDTEKIMGALKQSLETKMKSSFEEKMKASLES